MANDFGLSDGVDFGGVDYGSVGPLIGAATSLNSGSVFDVAKSADTATGNAVQGMAPITSGSSSGDGAFSSFWQSLAGSVVNTATQIVKQKNGVITTASNTPVVVAPPNPNRMLLLIVAAVAVVLVVTHKG